MLQKYISFTLNADFSNNNSLYYYLVSATFFIFHIIVFLDNISGISIDA